MPMNMRQLRKIIKGNPKVDQNIDLDGDEGFLLYLNDGWNWEAGDPGCHTRGWPWHEATAKEIRSDLKYLAPCDGSCGSDECKQLFKGETK